MDDGSKRFVWPYRYQEHQSAGIPVPYKGGTDRLRFIHMGLGKRESSSYSETSNKLGGSGSEDNERMVKTLNILFKGLLKADHDEHPASNPSYLAARPEANLQHTILFRALQSLNDLQNKRAPEEFSEQLYPIQAGKQQLEVSLDKTLNTDDSLYSYSEETDDDQQLMPNDMAKDTDIGSDVRLKNVFETNTETPYDLIFASPDLDVVYTPDKVPPEIKNTVGQSATNEKQRRKRWWAARLLSQFRAPKSWTRTDSHIDPALYFLGLGK